MKVGKAVLIIFNAILCLLFGIFVLMFNQLAKPFIRGFYCDDNSINKPFKESTIPSLYVVIVVGALAIICFVIGHIFNFIVPAIKEGKTFLNTSKRTIKVFLCNFIILVMILLHGMGVTMFITDIGKYSVGRLRPHFYAVCKPNWSELNCTLSDGRKNYFVGNNHCTSEKKVSWKFKDARLSFPSGHASFSAYSATFLILYIQFFMPIDNTFLRLPKQFVQLGLASLAIYCGLSRISDYKHHPTDVLAGLLLGLFVGVFIFFFMLRSCMPLMKTRINSRESVHSAQNEVNLTNIENL